MPNPQQDSSASTFWGQVASATATLPYGDEHYIMSLDNWSKGTNAGRVSITTRLIAGRCIAMATHRSATAEEIVAWVGENDARRRAILRTESDRQPKTVMQEGMLAELFTAAAQAAAVAQKQPAPRAQKGEN